MRFEVLMEMKLSAGLLGCKAMWTFSSEDGGKYSSETLAFTYRST
jgi:hypothetical protein